MEQYIKKSALVAEIEKLIRKNELYLDDNASDPVRFQKTGAYSVLCDLRHFLNTLEVKGVDIEREMQAFAKINLEPLVISDSNIGISITMSQLYDCAKHFFELGMAVSNKTQKGEEE